MRVYLRDGTVAERRFPISAVTIKLLLLLLFLWCVSLPLSLIPCTVLEIILKGTVQGGRRRDRQRKRWEDSIKEWTGLEWNIILRKAENREE